jgi:hypothetical protein
MGIEHTRTPSFKLKFKPHISAHTPPIPPKLIIPKFVSQRNPAINHEITHYKSSQNANPRTQLLAHTTRLTSVTMKLLTLNFLTCAIKTCKTNPLSFPLHPRDAELEIQEADLNLPFLKNILPRLMWEEIRTIATEVSLYHTHSQTSRLHTNQG